MTIDAVVLLIAVLGLTLPQWHNELSSLKIDSALEVAIGLTKLFGALVLFLFPRARERTRLYWMATGVLVLALAGIEFGYAQPQMGVPLDVETAGYLWLGTSTVASCLFCIALLPRSPVRFRWGFPLAVLGGGGLIAALLERHIVALPLLSGHLGVVDPEPNVGLGTVTWWHVVVMLIPLGLSMAAVVGGQRRYREGTVGIWIPAAMLLFAVSLLYSAFSVSPYVQMLSSTDLIRLAFSIVFGVGGMLELRRIVDRRTARLAIETEQGEHLLELTRLKANFTSMVAHELGNPVAAIKMSTEMLRTQELAPEDQKVLLDSIRSEIGLLNVLVADVRSTGTVEAHDFNIRGLPIPLRQLILSAIAYARSLPGNHPISAPAMLNEVVWADPDRIGQLLRNLLSNAAKYSPPGTPIAILSQRIGDRVRILVSDQGYGIHPDDMARIFEKFGRGRDQSGQRVRGVGLGLYISRRIARGHGSDLMVESKVGEGSTFAFDLEVIL